jgi:hypothetical protein
MRQGRSEFLHNTSLPSLSGYKKRTAGEHVRKNQRSRFRPFKGLTNRLSNNRLSTMKTKSVGMMTMRKFFLIALLAFAMPVAASAQQVPDPDLSREAPDGSKNDSMGAADAADDAEPENEMTQGEEPGEAPREAEGPMVDDAPDGQDVGQSEGMGQAEEEAPTETGIFPQSSERRLSADDLSTLGCDDLWVARNEIFHRNGYCFRSQRGQEYFDNSGCTSQSQDILSELEWDNVRLIQNAERTNRCS